MACLRPTSLKLAWISASRMGVDTMGGVVLLVTTVSDKKSLKVQPDYIPTSSKK